MKQINRLIKQQPLCFANHALLSLLLISIGIFSVSIISSCKPETVVIANPDRAEKKPAQNKDPGFPTKTKTKQTETATKNPPTTEGVEAITTTETISFEEYRQGMQLAQQFDLISPVPYMVFQRDNNNSGNIEVRLDRASSLLI